jgi:transcriptional regulator with XRE-family HTH domain
MQETIGKRIARLRQESGWTQQSLAVRLAISRVAVSQIEMDLTLPSERTVTLLAGLFKLTPQALVEATTYPQAKADRLPQVACCYTPLEHDLALLENDLAWLSRTKDSEDWLQTATEIKEKWKARLEERAHNLFDEREKKSLEVAWEALQQILI